MAKSRLIGSYPVIGIRPTIDGRRGALDVRGSLEDQTMNMAKSAAKLFEENLRYSNGEPVKVVIADTTIGRVGESAACADKFRREGVDITLTVTPCWCYGAETMDMDPQTIKAVWGFNGTERPGAVYLAAVLAGHAQKGLPAFGIYGRDVQDLDDNTIPADVAEKILRFARAAQAVATMRGKSYLSMGSVSMGIAGSIVNPDFFQEYLGMRNESVDLTESTIQANSRLFDSIDDVPRQAYTMGTQTIMYARMILVVANGEAKAQAVHDMCYGPVTPECPASILQLHTNCVVVADEAALSLCE